MSINKRSAKDAIQFVIDNPSATLEDIRAMIPEYKTALPVNSWIAAFKRGLPNHLKENFANLTWQKQKDYLNK